VSSNTMCPGWYRYEKWRDVLIVVTSASATVTTAWMAGPYHLFTNEGQLAFAVIPQLACQALLFDFTFAYGVCPNISSSYVLEELAGGFLLEPTDPGFVPAMLLRNLWRTCVETRRKRLTHSILHKVF
jgi:hypothetical protein